MGQIKENHFFLIGISHKTAPVEVREKVSFETVSCVSLLHDIHMIPGVEECVILSTCNRTEIYMVISASPEEVQKRIEALILEKSDSQKDIFDFFYRYMGTQVIEHLFRVSCGLDSMILGESQIFGQVKNAYSTACDNKCTGPALNRLFHSAFRVGKKIRHETGIGEGVVSVSFAAVELAKDIFGNLDGRSVLLAGAGKTGELCARRLKDSGVEHLYIANRTLERAYDLASKLSGEVIMFESISDMCESVDIIITSVTSHEPIIKKSELSPYIQRRKGKPLFLIDLGVPRNIEPEVNDIDHTFLYNIDNLENVTLENLDKRKNEAEKAERMILSEVEDFCSWLSEREVIPMIRDLRVKYENIRKEEMEKIKTRVDPQIYESINLVTRRIVRKLIHKPIIALRASESGVSRESLIKSMQELFFDSQDDSENN